MFIITFNNFEKQKLLEILSKDGSPESKEFINRVNSCGGFYSFDEDNASFRYYGLPKELSYTSFTGRIEYR